MKHLSLNIALLGKINLSCGYLPLIAMLVIIISGTASVNTSLPKGTKAIIKAKAIGGEIKFVLTTKVS